ncbi:GDYXXLXY domain-containing protein [uncultured Piscinibacter sp.]|uniref:GDYXXLXY domain-containing protein n=1 Tax=uncultured Piscinibacter sp. TaxID=1131835 RepID=UPI0026300938|nr:GDYXXLXY domain-containing protein [uncultured Piscinibacter sp.]
MSRTTLDAVMQAARAQGLLPPDAGPPRGETRPWPVVLLTALGAWLAAIPLLGVVGMLLGDLISRSIGPYVVGGLLIAGAVVVLRSRDVPLFVEQLAVPALLVGGGSLGFGLFRDAGTAAGAALLGLLALAVATGIRSAWLRVLLGAAAAVMLAIALTPQRWHIGRGDSPQQWWLAWHLLLAVWVGALWAQRRLLHGHSAAAVESIGAGWSLALLAAFAWWSGMTFLVGGTLGGGFAAEIVRELGRRDDTGASWLTLQAASALLALAGAVIAARRWPALRRPALAGAAVVLVALAALMPSLGATWLTLALLATSGRHRLAAAAGVAATWIVGAFYYQLAWPLATKAAVLAAAGALLAALAWWAGAGRRLDAATLSPRPSTPRLARGGIGLALVAILAVANLGIREKETLIRDGQAVFVELAPVDPRSLMQGDFMRLNFNLPGEPVERRAGMLRMQRPHVVARRDERGVATLSRIDDGTPLAAGEMRIELTPKEGRWILVSDAWFFREGEAKRWERAKYGEFRVTSDGRALLVGLRGPGLELL